MKILLIDNGTRHLGKLKDLLMGNEIDTHSLFTPYPPLDSYDLVVLSGGSQIAIHWAPEVFKSESDLIKNSEIPIIGICMGCELIAHTFGSSLEFIESGNKGIKDIKPISENGFLNTDEIIQVYESHHWAITKIGKDLEGIAKSKYGYEIIKHKEKSIYGLQFHPEMFVEETTGKDIYKKIIGSIFRSTK